MSRDDEMPPEDSMDFMPNDVDLTKLEAAVALDPSNYSAHLQLIAACKQSGELEKLRQARLQMLGNFPLAPNLWLDWINDELNFAENSEKQVETVKELFGRAVADYTSFEIWFEFVQWACGTGDTSFTREIFERAIASVGLHVSKGCLIWDAYREFELALLSLMLAKQDLGLHASSSSTEESVLKQRSIVTSIFKRQMSLPLIGIEEAYKDYLEFSAGQPAEKSVESAFESSLKTLNSLKPYEDALDDTEKTNSIEKYWSYLDFELSNSNCPPARLKCLFERAITDNCLNVDLWLKYLDWLDKRLKDKTQSLDGYLRAVRNCPWASKIWLNYLLSMERMGAPPEELANIFSIALAEGGYSSARECSQLWLTRIYQLRRLTAKLDVTSNYATLKQMFEDGQKFLMEKFSPLGWDADCSYRRAWARAEATLMQDIPAFRNLYDQIMADSGNGRRAQAWLQYFGAECEFNRTGDWQFARKLLVKACNSAADFPEQIFAQFLHFEEEHGTLSDLDSAQQRIDQQRARLKERNQANIKKQSKEKPSASKTHVPKKRYHADCEDHTAEKLADVAVTPQLGIESVNKRPKIDAEFVIPRAPPPCGPRVPSDAKIANTPTAMSLDAQAKFESNWSAQKTAVRQGTAGIDTSKYDRTVFVSNLDFKIDEQQIKSIFVEYGLKISEVRLVVLRPGRSKGYGYVELEKPADVAEALKLDRVKIDGRPMYISKCIDKKAAGASTSETHLQNLPPPGFSYVTGLEKNKLFVKNLHGRTTEADLQQFFKPYGNLLSVRLVVHKSGQSKGLAYVEYSDDQSAHKALMATDQSILMGRKLGVAISNPPPKTASSKLDFSESYGPVGQKSACSTMMPRQVVSSSAVVTSSHRRTHITANLGKPSAPNSAVSNGVLDGGGVNSEQGKKTNEEFRKMFLK